MNRLPPQHCIMLTRSYLVLIWETDNFPSHLLCCVKSYYTKRLQELFWIKGDFSKVFSKSGWPFHTRRKLFQSGCQPRITDQLPDSRISSRLVYCASVYTFVYHMLLHNKHFRSDVLCVERCVPLGLCNLRISDTPLSPRMHFQRVTKHGSPTETETLDWSALSR